MSLHLYIIDCFSNTSEMERVCNSCESVIKCEIVNSLHEFQCSITEGLKSDQNPNDRIILLINASSLDNSIENEFETLKTQFDVNKIPIVVFSHNNSDSIKNWYDLGANFVIRNQSESDFVRNLKMILEFLGVIALPKISFA